MGCKIRNLQKRERDQIHVIVKVTLTLLLNYAMNRYIRSSNMLYKEYGSFARQCLRARNKNLVITFEPVEIGFFQFTCTFLVTRPFYDIGTTIQDLVTFTLKLKILSNNFNLGDNL